MSSSVFPHRNCFLLCVFMQLKGEVEVTSDFMQLLGSIWTMLRKAADRESIPGQQLLGFEKIKPPQEAAAAAAD